jgi:hypothetical protein
MFISMTNRLNSMRIKKFLALEQESRLKEDDVL